MIRIVLKLVFRSYRKPVALFAAALLFALFAGMHSMHNHHADFKDHHDCPVHKIEIILSSALVLSAAVLFSFIKHEKVITTLKVMIITSVISRERPRAPPFLRTTTM